VCSNVEDWALADIDPDGSKRWDVTHIKTRDAFTHDAVIITREHIRFVDYYLSNIRPDFIKLFVARKHDSTQVKDRHTSGMHVCRSAQCFTNRYADVRCADVLM
jgi:hypothetical protein